MISAKSLNLMGALGMGCTFTSSAEVPPVHFNKNLCSEALKSKSLLKT